MHPTGSHIAVAERSSTNAAPHVFVYAIPSLELTHVLCGGTERAYSDVSFSGNGEKIVTVGSFPDFLLSVWDWREQRNVLKTKAFGQEVRPPALLSAPEAVRRTRGPCCPCCCCSAGLQRPLLGRRRRAHPDVRHRPRALLAHGGDLHGPQAAGGPADARAVAESDEALTRASPPPASLTGRHRQVRTRRPLRRHGLLRPRRRQGRHDVRVWLPVALGRHLHQDAGTLGPRSGTASPHDAGCDSDRPLRLLVISASTPHPPPPRRSAVRSRSSPSRQTLALQWPRRLTAAMWRPLAAAGRRSTPAWQRLQRRRHLPRNCSSRPWGA